MKHRILSQLISGLLLFLFQITLVCAADFQSDYQQGLMAFRNGDYELALNWFQSAKLKHDGPSSHIAFNLGSSLYKLERYQDAYDAFADAAIDPRFYVLSQINMALCGGKLNNRQLVAKHLSNALPVAKTTRHKQQLYQISQHYGFDELYSSQLRRWSGKLEISLGQDNNVILQESTSNTGTIASGTSAAYVTSLLNLSFNPARYIGISALAYDIKYESGEELKQNNYRIFELKPRLSVTGTNRQWQLYVSRAWSKLGDEPFLFDNNVGTTFGWQFSPRWQTKLGYHYRDHESQTTEYQHLTGNEVNSSLSLSYLRSSLTLALEYGSQSNDREDHYQTTESGEQKLLESFSPQRWYSSFDVRWQLWSKLGVHLHLLYRESDYPQADTQMRADQRWFADASLLYSLSPAWSVHLIYQRVDNRSNLERYDYDTYHVLSGLGYRF